MNRFNLVASGTHKLTKTLAEEFRSLEPSPTERDLDKGRVKHLREKAEAGRLVTFNWSKARLGSRILRMNGQHSSTMLCELNGAFPENLSVHIDEYEVDDEESLALLFRQFDDRKSGRTPADVSGAYQMLYEPLFKVPKPAAKLAAEAVSWHRKNIDGLPHGQGDDRYLVFKETALHGFIRWIGEILGVKTPEMKKETIVAAMYATFMANETDARKFWNDVARGGVEYEEDAPATVLDGWLKSLIVKKNGIKPAEYFQGAIYAWNAFREEKPIVKGIRFDASKGFHPVV